MSLGPWRHRSRLLPSWETRQVQAAAVMDTIFHSQGSRALRHTFMVLVAGMGTLGVAFAADFSTPAAALKSLEAAYAA